MSKITIEQVGEVQKITVDGVTHSISGKLCIDGEAIIPIPTVHSVKQTILFYLEKAVKNSNVELMQALSRTYQQIEC